MIEPEGERGIATRLRQVPVVLIAKVSL